MHWVIEGIPSIDTTPHPLKVFPMYRANNPSTRHRESGDGKRSFDYNTSLPHAPRIFLILTFTKANRGWYVVATTRRRHSKYPGTLHGKGDVLWNSMIQLILTQLTR